ncbi:MAG: type I DNA topoisomerase [Alphaproteobacteria bacterium]
MNLVIVESPAKAKSIKKYLGANYSVLASYGHIRDLASKNGSVDPDHDFKMVWEANKGSEKNIKSIADAIKKADSLYLATDPDREGEAIAWHICEVLKQKKLLKDVEVHRSVFNEITKKAIVEAIHHPRKLNQELVDAYLARRALDYLVGFTLSPVLWHKLPGSKSAGRVQSVALRLITDREFEIEKFISEEYWSLEVECQSPQKKSFTARLLELHQKKVEKFSFRNEKDAKEAAATIEKKTFAVHKVQKKQTQRNPYPPFTTSTLQQESVRKLGFSASKAMLLAQQLYEGMEVDGESIGLITYMRTDSVNLSQEAISAFRVYIESDLGVSYLPKEPRFYKSKAKNAQEAHEAIRPTDVSLTPDRLRSILNADQLKLYTMIWKRALASQMTNALIDQVTVDIASSDKEVLLRTTGSTIAFDGFLKLYQESKDEGDDPEDDEKTLPPLNEGDAIHKEKVIPSQHFTQPPPRFTEASLVKKLEELGIGRPSTYASILHVLQARNYVRLTNKQFIPEDRGRMVSVFLHTYFKQYVEYDFTANLEDSLDDISNGKKEWKEVLSKFWIDFKKTVHGTDKLTITEVLDVLDRELADSIFPKENGKISKKCPKCEKGTLHLKLGKYGAFLGCDQYPECTYSHKLSSSEDTEETGEDQAAAAKDGEEYPKVLGTHPDTKEEITLRKGPYGVYVQMGEDSKKKKPKRTSVPKSLPPKSVTLQNAVDLLSLPRTVGVNPKTNEVITASIGPYGPYVKHGSKFVSVKNQDILSITLEEALALIQHAEDNPPAKRSFRKKTKK